MPQPNWLVTVGLAKETVWGTAVTPPTTFLSTSAPVFTEKQVTVFDKGLRGIRSATQSMSFGAGHAEIDIPGMPWYGDDSGHLLMGMMGSDVLTGSTANTGTVNATSNSGTSTLTVLGFAPTAGGGQYFTVNPNSATAEVVLSASAAGQVITTTTPLKSTHVATEPIKQLAIHTLSLLNNAQPPSYTLAKYDGLNTTNARQIAGCYFEDVAIKFASTAGLTMDAKARGKMGTNVAKGTAVYSSESFNVPWQAAFTINAIANARVVDFTINIKATNDQIFGMNATQSPTAAISDQLTVTGTFTIVPDDYTELNYYLQNTQPAVSILLDNGNTQTVFQMSKVALIDPVTFAHSGNYTTLTATFEAISNVTDAGQPSGNAPFKAILRNQKGVVY